MKKFLMVVAFLLLSVNAFGWGLPAIGGGGGDAVDVKGLSGRSDKLCNAVYDATEKLTLATIDVLHLSGKTDEANNLAEKLAAYNSDRKAKSKSFFENLASTAANFKKMKLKTELEKYAKVAIALHPVGSAALNLKGAVDNDIVAVKEAKALAEDLSKGIKSASSNPALATSVGDLKAAYEAVTLIVDNVPVQIELGTMLLKELSEYAEKNNITLK